MKYLYLLIYCLISLVFISNSVAQNQPFTIPNLDPNRASDEINKALLLSGLDTYRGNSKPPMVEIINGLPKITCLDDEDTTTYAEQTCLDRKEKFQKNLENDDEDKERKKTEEQECKSKIEKFEAARTEMLEHCTAGNDCEKQVRTCLECQDDPEFCEILSDDDEDVKKSADQKKLSAFKNKFQMCPIISAQTIDKAEEKYKDLKEKTSEKTTEVQEAMQELVQKRNKDKVEIEELENELLAKKKELTQAMEDRNTLMQEAELEVKQKISELDTEVEKQRLGLQNAQLKFAEKKEEIIDAETELQIACYDQANARMQASRKKSLQRLRDNKTLLRNTNEFLTQSSRKLSTNQNAMFNAYFSMCWSKDKKTALKRRSLKRKERFFKKQYDQAVSVVEKALETMKTRRKQLIESAGLAIQKAAMKAERNISNKQTELMAIQRKINSKKQENQTTMAADAQKLMHNQQQLQNLSKEEDFAQRIYDIHARHANGESTEPGEISKAITKYQVALDKAAAAVRACSGQKAIGDCSTAHEFIQRSDLSSIMPVNDNCESYTSGSGGSGANTGLTEQ